MMKLATALISFYDLQDGVPRHVGDVFLCNEERGAYLEGLGLVRLKDAPAEKPKRTRKAKK